MYLIFGVLTTLVNFAAFHGFSLLFGEGLYLLSNAAAWAVAVIFAYATNKLVVFRAKSSTASALLREASEFIAARLASLAIEEAGLLLLVGVLGIGKISIGPMSGQMLAKIVLAILVVSVNYFFSKLVIFKK